MAGGFSDRTALRPYWRRQVILGAPSAAGVNQLAADGSATTAGSLDVTTTTPTPGFFNNRLPPHVYERVWWRRQQLLVAPGPYVQGLAADGAATTAGSLDVTTVTPTPGFFNNRPAPQQLALGRSPYWRRQLPLVDRSSTGLIQLAADGAATTAGSLALTVLVDLRADGAATTLGSLALVVIIDLQFLGAATSVGTLALVLASPATGIFNGRPAPQQVALAQAFWRRQLVLGGQRVGPPTTLRHVVLDTESSATVSDTESTSHVSDLESAAKVLATVEGS